MGVITTLRTQSSSRRGGHPYVDTPDFAYHDWLRYLENQQRPIGSVNAAPPVAVIGAGVSGLCAAYELVRAGCTVHVFEQSKEVGGRCTSVRFAGDAFDVAELGAMRFPPSQFLLDYYLQRLGIAPAGLENMPDFPDPGVQTTYLCYEGRTDVWVAGELPPAAFTTVANGWHAFVQHGLMRSGKRVLQPASVITHALAVADVERATSYWQAYLDLFGQKTFYSALYEIFTGSGGCDVPGGAPWSSADFDRFGALGIGSGGFGPLFSIGFIDIFRLMVDELETHQKFLQPSETLDCGIRTLPNRFAQEIGQRGRLFFDTPIHAIRRFGSGFVLDGVPGEIVYGKVIVATTTRAMELTLDLTAFGNGALLAPDVSKAIMRTYVIASNKVAARIKNFWAGDPKAVRCLQTDGLVRQVYTLDYTPAGAPPDPAGVCFISYVWNDDAIKQQAITAGAPDNPDDKEKLYRYLLDRLRAIGGDVAEWAEKLRPLDDDYAGNVVYEEWQSNPYYAGAFKLSQPGQDLYVQSMFFDYQKCGSARDTGVYLAGDCISWTSGWVEGALTTALNAAAAVITSLGGTVHTDANGSTPLSIHSGRFRYFG